MSNRNVSGLSRSDLHVLQKATENGGFDLTQVRAATWTEIFTIAKDQGIRARTRLRAAALIVSRTDPVNQPPPQEPITAININMLAPEHGHTKSITDGNGLKIRFIRD
jgi:hypothetical protein